MRQFFKIMVFIAIGVAPFSVAWADAATPTASQSDQTSQLQSTGDAASTPQTSGLLQPAGTSGSPLQSADASGGGVGLSPIENLQQSGTSDQAKLLIEGDADSPHQVASSTNLSWLLYILLVLVAATGGTVVVWGLQRRRA